MLLLTFRTAENLYAVDAVRVAEVVPRVGLRPIPHAPAELAGLFGYRGQVVPVVDLGRLLGSVGAAADRLNTRIIVVDIAGGDTCRLAPRGSEPAGHSSASATDRAGSRRFGLIAEQVSDVTRATDDQIVFPPMRLPDAPYLGAIVQTKRGLAQLIEVDRVLSPTLREALFRSANDPAGGAAAELAPALVSVGRAGRGTDRPPDPLLETSTDESRESR
jgi:chemotaxis-related protein WspB